MTAPLSCEYQLLVELLAAIDHTDVPDEIAGCDEPAAFSTFVVRKRDGLDVELFVRTCAGHDEQFHALGGYARSIRLRQPTPDPS